MDHVVGGQSRPASVADLEGRARLAPLSPKERSILALIGCGQSNKEIAKDLGMAPETVKCHLKSIFRKLNVNKRTHAVSIAYRLGIVDPHPSSLTAPVVHTPA